MKIFKRSLFATILFATTLVFATGATTIVSDDKTNEEILNTNGATAIVNLSASATNGLAVCNYRIKSLPDAESGVLYMFDGVTPVTVDQNLTHSEAELLTFDPKEGYTSDATFTYTGIDASGEEGTLATVILPIVGETVTVSDETTESVEATETNNTVTDVSTTDTNAETLTVTTDDKRNPEMLNTLPAVDILNLSGKDANGVEVDNFLIKSIVIPEAGVLYMGDATTAVTVNQNLTKDEADLLKFDPLDTFVGDANFTYQAVDANGNLGNIATVTIPVVGTLTTDNNGSAADCECDDYDESIPVLSNFGILLMIMLTSLSGLFFTRKEI